MTLSYVVVIYIYIYIFQKGCSDHEFQLCTITFVMSVKWLTKCNMTIFEVLLDSFLLPNDHYDGVRMGTVASQITSRTIVYSIVYSDADQRKHQSSAALAFVREIHRGPVNSPHKWPVSRKMFPFDDVIMSFVHHKVGSPHKRESVSEV